MPQSPDTETPEDADGAPSPLRRPALIFGGTLLLLVLFLLIAFLSTVSSGHEALQRKIAELEWQGRRVTSAAMYPVCRPEENAAPLWDQAARDYRVSPEAEEAIVRAVRDWKTLTAEDKAVLRRHLAENSGVLETLREAASRPCFTADSPPAGTPVFAMKVPNMVRWAKRCRVFVLLAGRLAAEDGDTTRAVECVQLGAAMSRNFARLPLVISSWISLLMADITMTLAEEVLPGAPLPPEVAQQLKADLDPAVYREALFDGYENSRVGLLEETTCAVAERRLPIGVTAPGTAKLSPRGQRIVAIAMKPIILHDGVLIQDLLTSSAELMRLDPSRRPVPMEEVDRRRDELSRLSLWARGALQGFSFNWKRIDVVLARMEKLRRGI